MLIVYSLFIYISLPFVLLRLFWKSRQQPNYRQRIYERFAYHLPNTPVGKVLWFHAVSVGEFLSSKPLLICLLKRYPYLNIWITTTTPTGSAQVQRLQADYTQRIIHSYLPYDAPDIIRRFLRHIHPSGVILMETEIWPNLLTQAIHYCPVLLVNARLSAKSLRGYIRFARRLLSPTLKSLRISAQTVDDARRFRYLGAAQKHITVIPSMKYQPISSSAAPIDTPDNIRKQRTQIWLAASTHAPEEQYALAAHTQLSTRYPNIRLILAPRHPERTMQIAREIEQAGFQVCLRSRGEWFQKNNEILLLDTLGELQQFFHLACASFIGGSLLARGGHNPLEAVYAQSSVCFGPSMYNFSAIANTLRQTSFATQITHPQQLATAIHTLMKQNPKKINEIINFRQQYVHIIEQHADFIAHQLALYK